MPGKVIRQSNFSGGVISPFLKGRTDLDRYDHALATCHNFTPTLQGGLDNRPGLIQIEDLWTGDPGDIPIEGTYPVRLVPFYQTPEDSWVLAFGHNTAIPFDHDGVQATIPNGVAAYSGTAYYNRGMLVSEGGSVYICKRDYTTNQTPVGNPTYWQLYGNGVEGDPLVLATPFGGTALAKLKYAQANNFLQLTSRSGPPTEIIWNPGLGTWLLLTFRVTSDVFFPTGLSFFPLTTLSGHTAMPFQYQVVSVDEYGHENMVVGLGTDITTNLIRDPADPNPAGSSYEWASTPGAIGYKIYGGSHGTLGLIDWLNAPPLTGTRWIDKGTPIDFSTAPFMGRNPFATLGTWAATTPFALYARITNNGNHYLCVQAGTSGSVGPKTLERWIADGTCRWEWQAKASESQYPAVCAFFQQRRIFAGTPDQVGTIWGSKPGNIKWFDKTSIPPKDTDAFEFTLDGIRFNEIRSIVPFRGMMVFTAAGVAMLQGAGGSALGPVNVDMKWQAGNGCSWIDPILCGKSLLYIEDASGVVRDIAHEWQTDSFTSRDLSMLAEHLIRENPIVDWTYAPDKTALVWAVLEDGTMASLTYSVENQQASWASHSTDGTVKAICSIPVHGAQRIFVAVQRWRNDDQGEVVYYTALEYMDDRRKPSLAMGQAGWLKMNVFLDAAMFVYPNGTTNVLTGLQKLAGRLCNAIIGGHVFTNILVADDGTATLPVTIGGTGAIGLPYVSDVELLPVATKDAEVSPNQKLCNKVNFEVYQTRGLKAGEDFYHLHEAAPRRVSQNYDPLALVDDLVSVRIRSSWNDRGVAVLRQDMPLPVSILAVMRDIEIGGDD